MGRIRRPFLRVEEELSPKLFVVATEGRYTEPIYFEALSEELDHTKVHLEVLTKDNNNSSPRAVLEQLNAFAENYSLDEEDELWMVIDRDYQAWSEKMIKEVAQICHQKAGYFLALSNPCFELWLILHLVDVTTLAPKIQELLFQNKKVSSNKTYSKKMLADYLGGFKEADYPAQKLIPNVQDAIERAKKLDLHPNHRWPDYLSSRLDLLLESLLNFD